MEINARNRNLILAIELTLLLTAVIVTFIDYGLKRDILAMIAQAKGILSDERSDKANGYRPDTRRIRPGDLVGYPTGMETPGVPDATRSQASQAGTGRRKPAKRSAGNGTADFPESDNPVGS
jgi:hypothetical protein